MSKAGFWRRDGFLGLAAAAGSFLAATSDLIQSLERNAYEMGVRARTRAPFDRIAVIAIADASLHDGGPRPWLRDLDARSIETLTARHQTGEAFACALRLSIGTGAATRRDVYISP